MKLQDIITEVKVHRDDPAMDDMYDDAAREERDTKDAPYYVRWSGQSHEWYGEGGPEEGEGRYKSKGDGGRVVAINVPTYSQAQELASQLDAAYDENRFPDDSVYADYGKDWYVVDYHGTDIGSMSNLRKWEYEYDKPKDFK